jgi:hypothetical protein
LLFDDAATAGVAAAAGVMMAGVKVAELVELSAFASVLNSRLKSVELVPVVSAALKAGAGVIGGADAVCCGGVVVGATLGSDWLGAASAGFGAAVPPGTIVTFGATLRGPEEDSLFGISASRGATVAAATFGGADVVLACTAGLVSSFGLVSQFNSNRMPPSETRMIAM